MGHEALVIQVVGDALRCSPERSTPDWFLRPGIAECGDLWPSFCQAYNALTGRDLPDSMPSTESRRLDAYLPPPFDAFFEFDETQHFNVYRLKTYQFYPADFHPGYPISRWKAECELKKHLKGGGFGKPKPPLFPEQNGRHKQRAFRDMLADVLPPTWGHNPTIRVAHFEVDEWIQGPRAIERMQSLLTDRITKGTFQLGEGGDNASR